MQDEATGYWYDKKSDDLISAMAGASHNYHLYYYLNEPVPHYNKIIDHCLTILDNQVSSACLDIDVVDVLANMIKYRYREDDIKAYLKRKLDALLDYQNEDGGFADVMVGTMMFDGWQVYKEPQGISNCFGTWFRCAAIGMICCVLYPETRNQWHFRDTIGMGYYNKNYLEGVDIENELRKKSVKPKKIWLKAYEPRPDEVQDSGNETLSIEELSQKVCNTLNTKELKFFEQPSIFAFKITNMNNEIIVVSIDKGEARLIEYIKGDEHIMISVSSKNLLKIMNGKLMPVVAYATKRLGISGDMTLALKLQNLF